MGKRRFTISLTRLKMNTEAIFTKKKKGFNKTFRGYRPHQVVDWRVLADEERWPSSSGD